MRRVIFPLILVLTLSAGYLIAQTRKTPPPDVGSGRIAWFDLTSTNLAQSRDFYAKLFDWTFGPVQGSDQAFEIISRGTPIGTLRGADGKISSFNGVVYVQIADVVASCKKARELGATVVPGFPFNLPDGTGAIGLIADPSGHPIGLYSRTLIPAK